MTHFKPSIHPVFENLSPVKYSVTGAPVGDKVYKKNIDPKIEISKGLSMNPTKIQTLFLILIFITNQTSLISSNHSKTFSYVGSFRFPGVLDEKTPPVPVYYKGAIISIQEAGYILTDSKKHSEFLIVVSLLQAPTTNTIALFEVPLGQQYLLCSLKRKDAQKTLSFSKTTSFEETWEIAHKIEEGPFNVPEDSLVVLMEPTCVEKISCPVWSKEGNFVKLPTLTFKKDAQNSSAFNRAYCASLDVKPFHKADDIVSCQFNKKSISSFRKS